MRKIYCKRSCCSIRFEDENVIASHVEDVSNSYEEDVSSKHVENTNVQAKRRRGRQHTWKEWKVLEDDPGVLFNINSGEVKKAKRNEINNWNENKVFEEVEDHGQRTISMRWRVTKKKNGKIQIKTGSKRILRT
ncbi:unnamed protein product [Lepeophtheirus salmonis]|uniref:(salmon louse) hypothetical protein n=1 Tax=Lepeophtheirus salmonis TaxID=72036 RepID=A0A7R8D875_LEPSM|nr:unnamed protein product [Lepeophtheirus salmonis]CAF3006260.1 unnamed protein product [Lepeophtheirus salmonis]